VTAERAWALGEAESLGETHRSGRPARGAA